MNFSPEELLAVLVAASFAAGLNVYATVGTLGVLGHFGIVPLPTGLHLLESWWVIGPALVMFVVEFFADKVPAFDLIWNALSTFVRVPVAALVAYHASYQISPKAQLFSALLAAGISLAAHGGKTAIRAAVTPSPEPFSNIGLSLAEDAAAISLTWFALRHPYWAAGVTLFGIILVIIAIRWIWRAMARLFRGAVRVMAGEDPA